jgi:hypothetical protein
MFANRFMAFIDACVLQGALTRNMLLTLAEADFFRVRWSGPVLDETQRAVAGYLAKRGDPAAVAKGLAARAAMERAFADAAVEGWEDIANGILLPDPKDVHVLAAAVRAGASILVTDNLKDFPAAILTRYEIEAKAGDQFLADTIDLDIGRAVSAIARMRRRFNKPSLTPEALLLELEARGLFETADILRAHATAL